MPKSRVSAKRRQERYEQGLCWDCSQPVEPGKTRCRGCLDRCAQAAKAADERLKQAVMAAYGGACACCGEDTLIMLTIDHVAQDGAEARRKGQRTGPGFYRLLRKQGFPEGYRVLCWNCNTAVFYSPDHRCPHGTGCFS